MPYKTLYEELWETKDEEGYTRVQVIAPKHTTPSTIVSIRQSLTQANIKYNAVVILPSFLGIKAILLGLAEAEANNLFNGNMKKGIAKVKKEIKGWETTEKGGDINGNSRKESL